MLEVEGRQVYTTLEELVQPSHTALLVVDMQKDFCSPGYAFSQQGIDISMYAGMVPRLARLLGAARRAEVMVIFIQMTVLPHRRSESPAQIRFNMRMHLGERGPSQPLWYTLEGSPGQELIPELVPSEGELLVKKYRSSGFWGTNLDLLLRSNLIKTVLIGGCTTEGCVESTARDALFNDYYVVIAEDCVASDDRDQHQASMLLMRHRFDVAGSEEIIHTWGTQDAEQ
ncbi:MAG: isochorismatase family cysteine hydrolase [Candidatus Dormiibacterota bacterium]